MDSLLKLADNPIDVFEETSRLLIKIADNILQSPNNPKVRVLQKTNATIRKKVLDVNGGKACLQAMGFKENELNFSLPNTDLLNNLKQIRYEIIKLKDGEKGDAVKPEKLCEATTSISSKSKTEEKPVQDQAKEKKVQSIANGLVPEHFKRIVLPEYSSLFTNPFLKEIETLFHRALFYENSYLQKRALSVIPCKVLESNAQVALRKLQEKLKKEKLKDPEVTLQDFLILELLAWFKDDFFEWVDNPSCVQCSGKTKFSHLSEDKDLLVYTNRVEMHKCTICENLTPFPRYNDLNILLETRKGRCGEWANVFTLMCRAMGWDARFVMDQTDHVWTEVYSFGQRRWLHCDPCENMCDKPLMYEAGWGKTVSYVMAFSGDEVQDVTWRYTSQHQAVRRRRTKCEEQDLVDAMYMMREQRQSSLSLSRKEYLRKRFLTEVIELMIERQPTDDAKEGRSSGSLDWRLSRGETMRLFGRFVWLFNTQDVCKEFVIVQFSSALNQYLKKTPEKSAALKYWQAGVFETEGIFRKVEKDWKKVYLCRNEKSSSGHITWKFMIADDNYSFASIDFIMEQRTFENGTITTKLCNDNHCVLVTSDKGTTNDFTGSKQISITTMFAGGQGDAAWQHAQLCREDLDGSDYTVKFKFTFKKL